MKKIEHSGQKRVGKKNSSYIYDKFELYNRAVQSADSDVVFLQDVYTDLKKKRPIIMREDFCGTFALSCEWVKLNRNYRAIGVDLDPEPINYGKNNYLNKLTPDQKNRIIILEENVLSKNLPKADILIALNFSYFIFKQRNEMKKYFSNVLSGLKKDGIFVVDLFGGSQCYDAIEDRTDHKKFTYYWDQSGFNPVTNEALFYIHFKVGRKKVKRVFTYDWRLWSIPELREIMDEVGFKKTHVYWEGTKKDGTGDGNFTRTEKGESCLSWIAYIVAEA